MSRCAPRGANQDVQYAKNLSPIGLLQTRMQMLAMMHESDMYTRTGQRARERVESVHVAQTRVDTIAKAVMPEG